MLCRSAWLALVVSLCGCHDQSPSPQAGAADIAKQALAPRQEVDVPVLASMQGTLEPMEGHAIVLTGAPGEVEAQRAALPEHGATLLAIGRDVELKAAQRSIDDIWSRGRGDLEILVRAGNTRRIVMIEKFRALANSDALEATAEIDLGATIELDHQTVTLEALAAAIARDKPTMIVVVPEPTVTMQRIVEVVAAAGGCAYVGAGILPHVEAPLRISPR